MSKRPPFRIPAFISQYSDQWQGSPTFSNSVAHWTRRLALSSRPKQQNSRAKALRLRGVRPSYGPSFCSELELEVDDAGLSGMVALAKMSESALRYRVSVAYCCDRFSDASEYGEGNRDPSDANDVSRGESICIWRFARGELGRPIGPRDG